MKESLKFLTTILKEVGETSFVFAIVIFQLLFIAFFWCAGFALAIFFERYTLVSPAVAVGALVLLLIVFRILAKQVKQHTLSRKAQTGIMCLLVTIYAVASYALYVQGRVNDIRCWQKLGRTMAYSNKMCSAQKAEVLCSHLKPFFLDGIRLCEWQKSTMEELQKDTRWYGKD